MASLLLCAKDDIVSQVHAPSRHRPSDQQSVQLDDTDTCIQVWWTMFYFSDDSILAAEWNIILENFDARPGVNASSRSICSVSCDLCAGKRNRLSINMERRVFLKMNYKVLSIVWVTEFHFLKPNWHFIWLDESFFCCMALNRFSISDTTVINIDMK